MLDWRAIVMIWLPVLAITYLHYTTPGHFSRLHDVFRRLYYIPIILAAFGYGLKGGLKASVVISLLYLPHAFIDTGFVIDPDPALDKALEILLYNIIGAVTGYLVQAEQRERIRQESVSRDLKRALDEKKALEEQLVRIEKLKALGELTAGIAHEIKNPLASIKGASEAIADEVPEGSPKRKLVDIQARELDRLEQTLERFLAFARPGEFLARELDLQDLVDHVSALLASRLKSKEIELECERPPWPTTIQGDRDQLVQVLVNLVLNSLDAVPRGGGIKVLFRRETMESGTYLVLDVEDDGPGVPEQKREKIFDPFFSGKPGGTGLGLSISANIMASHGGFIKVTKAGYLAGARFSLFFPLNGRSTIH
ncbi:MAG: sensor histidine kinase [Deltaproteobacteria bacterium]|nr:sensor histidine kinase [Deltaproteobacteria bacterium]